MAISTASSRFALLKIEGSDDEESSKSNTKSQKKGAPGSAKPKKRNKKKGNSDAADLRSLAFGSGKASGGSSRAHNDGGNTAQYESWAEHDKDQVDEIFQQELQQAILMSKVELEKNADMSNNTQVHEQPEPPQAKKKGKKNKPKSISIDEFQHGAPQLDQPKDELRPERRSKAAGDSFFNEVESDAALIVRKDKLQEEYQKQFKVQAVLQAKYNTELENKDKTIEELRTKLSEYEEQLLRAKKRNKQLCFILGQGEMKEKAEILQQVDSLNQIKDELTAQVTTLTSELEKERSKVHSLQNDLSKSKQKSK